MSGGGGPAPREAGPSHGAGRRVVPDARGPGRSRLCRPSRAFAGSASPPAAAPCSPCPCDYAPRVRGAPRAARIGVRGRLRAPLPGAGGRRQPCRASGPWTCTGRQTAAGRAEPPGRGAPRGGAPRPRGSRHGLDDTGSTTRTADAARGSPHGAAGVARAQTHGEGGPGPRVGVGKQAGWQGRTAAAALVHPVLLPTCRREGTGRTRGSPPAAERGRLRSEGAARGTTARLGPHEEPETGRTRPRPERPPPAAATAPPPRSRPTDAAAPHAWRRAALSSGPGGAYGRAIGPGPRCGDVPGQRRRRPRRQAGRKRSAVSAASCGRCGTRWCAPAGASRPRCGGRR